MKPAELEEVVPVKQGDTFYFVLNYTDSDQHTMDLRNVEVLFQMRSKPRGELHLSASTADDTITVSDVDPNIVIEVPAETTVDFNSVRGVWDLQLTYLDGTRDTILTGKYELIEDIAWDDGDEPPEKVEP